MRRDRGDPAFLQKAKFYVHREKYKKRFNTINFVEVKFYIEWITFGFKTVTTKFI